MSALREYLINAIAAAAAIGAGGAIVNGAVTNARQDEQLRAATIMLPEIQKDVKATRETVIRLEARDQAREQSQ
jgi:hypothetical protein